MHEGGCNDSSVTEEDDFEEAIWLYDELVQQVYNYLSLKNISELSLNLTNVS